MLEGYGIIKQLRNPAYGLLPMFTFTLLVCFVDVWIAISVGLAISLAGTFLVRTHSRMLYDISLITFVFAIVMNLLYPSLDVFGKFVLIEIIFVVALMASRLTRSKVISHLARNDRGYVRNYLSESFRVAFQTQYSLIFHLVLILVYYVFSTIRIPISNHFPIIILSLLIYASIIIVQIVRLRILDKKLNSEEWLPVVNESGQVTGRVAKSVSLSMKNKYLHPVVRVALINNGRLYLAKRKANKTLSPGMYDYPFEKYVQYNHDIQEGVFNAIRNEIGDNSIPTQFILKYIFENEETRRLILLYVSIVDDDEKFNTLRFDDGKLWTIKQIDENIGSNVFSECFELEFEYLKNTVLLKYI